MKTYNFQFTFRCDVSPKLHTGNLYEVSVFVSTAGKYRYGKTCFQSIKHHKKVKAMNESHFLHLHVTRPHNRIAEDSVFTAQARSLLVYADFRLLPLCLCLIPPMDWKYKIFTHFGIGPSQQSSNLNVFRLNEDNELENERRTVVRSVAALAYWFDLICKSDIELWSF